MKKGTKIAIGFAFALIVGAIVFMIVKTIRSKNQLSSTTRSATDTSGTATPTIIPKRISPNIKNVGALIDLRNQLVSQGKI